MYIFCNLKKAELILYPSNLRLILPTKNKPLFSYQKCDTCLEYLPKGCPYMLMYSASHIVHCFSQNSDVFTPKIRQKISDFNIFMNQNKRCFQNLRVIVNTIPPPPVPYKHNINNCVFLQLSNSC